MLIHYILTYIVIFIHYMYIFYSLYYYHILFSLFDIYSLISSSLFIIYSYISYCLILLSYIIVLVHYLHKFYSFTYLIFQRLRYFVQCRSLPWSHRDLFNIRESATLLRRRLPHILPGSLWIETLITEHSTVKKLFHLFFPLSWISVLPMVVIYAVIFLVRFYTLYAWNGKQIQNSPDNSNAGWNIGWSQDFAIT